MVNKRPFIVLYKTTQGVPCTWEKGGSGEYTVMIADGTGAPKVPIHIVKPHEVRPNGKQALFPVDLGDIIAIGQDAEDKRFCFKQLYKVAAYSTESHAGKPPVLKAILEPVPLLKAQLKFRKFYQAFTDKLRAYSCSRSFYHTGG